MWYDSLEVTLNVEDKKNGTDATGMEKLILCLTSKEDDTAPEGISNSPKISLNGADSSVSFKNAVFEELFEVTAYYTIKESGCKEPLKEEKSSV